MGLESPHSPKVSILLPTYNRADVLPFAIHSVLAQTIEDFELLIMGDGCTDKTVEIVQSFNDPRIHWFDLPKTPGFGYANRNIVLKKARGEYIAFMPHDDLWLTDHLEKLVLLFNNKAIEIVYSRPLWVIPIGMIVPGMFNLNQPPTLKTFLNIGNAIPAGCVIHRKSCFSKYGYWNDALPRAADWDMWVRIIKGGGEKNFAYFDEPTCLHFKADWHDDSYEYAIGFRFWKRLFDSGQLPACLNFYVKKGKSEQEAGWELLSANPEEWINNLRSAIQQVDSQKTLRNLRITLALILYENLAYNYYWLKLNQIIFYPIRRYLSRIIQFTIRHF